MNHPDPDSLPQHHHPSLNYPRLNLSDFQISTPTVGAFFMVLQSQSAIR